MRLPFYLKFFYWLKFNTITYIILPIQSQGNSKVEKIIAKLSKANAHCRMHRQGNVGAEPLTCVSAEPLHTNVAHTQGRWAATYTFRNTHQHIGMLGQDSPRKSSLASCNASLNGINHTCLSTLQCGIISNR